MKNNKVYYALVIPESEWSRMQVKDPFNSANEIRASRQKIDSIVVIYA